LHRGLQRDGRRHVNRVTFIPWEAVLSIRGTKEQEREEGGGRLTREQVAELSQRENV
jgi:hypothetical protein